jgi:amicyanin
MSNVRRFEILAMYVLVVILALGLSIGIESYVRPNTMTAAVAKTTSPTTVPVQEAQVEIDNFAFKPMELTIPAGTTVTWVNKDDVPHTATSSDDPVAFDSKTLDTDQKYSLTFGNPGTYNYYCKPHPFMTGTVIVK